jgi:peptidoglycan/LPS O-acetylase OafA/YrhL
MRNGELLSRTESSALRGIAILGIILHNYCHFLGFAVKENEYKFDAERPMQFLDKLFSLDSDLFIHFFSFLGHYGVPIFLFISGYGLVKKYEAQPQQPASAKEASPSGTFGGAFIKKHFLKLFRLMIIGYLLFIGVYLLRHSDGAQVYSWDRVLTQLTMTINFLYFDPDHIIKPGPYWFFGLMLQLYALYILVIHRWRSNWLLLALALGSVVLEACFAGSQDWLNYVRYNFIGGLLPFCMGVWMARKEIPIRPTPNPPYREGAITPVPKDSTSQSLGMLLGWVVISALFVLFGSLNYWTWLFVPAFVVTGAIATVRLLIACKGFLSPLSSLLSPLSWLGSISAMLFVMHPVIRELIIGHYRKVDIYGGIFIYLLSSVALAMLLKWILRYVPKP